MKIFPAIEKYKRHQVLKILRNSPPEKFEAASIKKLLKTFHRSIKISPAYRDILQNHKLQTADIKNIRDFTSRVPVLNKENYFNHYTYSELLGENQDRMKSAMSSSGFSGNFAFGFSSERALKSGRSGVDTTLDYWFDISNRKTFIINCAPMGVHVETSLPLAETSVRSDMALSLLKKVSPEYDQTILVGDPHFLKKLIEEGDEQKIDWKKLQVSIITAQDWLPETLRTYLANRLGIDIDNHDSRGIYATMGMTELGLNVFHESKYTVAIRRKIIHDEKLRKILVHSNQATSPYFFHYYPFRTYIESHKTEDQEELLFSVVDKQSILPVIRYLTGDLGKVFAYKNLSEILSDGYPQFIPDLKLPIAIMSGRTKSKIKSASGDLYIEDIKEKLYSDFLVTSSITGLLRIKPHEKRIQLSIHLKNKIQKNKSLEMKIYHLMNDHFSNEIEVKLFNYNEFLDGLELNYEKKLFLC